MSAEFPFIGTEIEVEETELPLFEQPAWDFNNDKFIYDGNGFHVIVTGKEALKVWIYKALKTERYSYIAYSWQYGIELHPFIGKVMSVQERYSERGSGRRDGCRNRSAPSSDDNARRSNKARGRNGYGRGK